MPWDSISVKSRGWKDVLALRLRHERNVPVPVIPIAVCQERGDRFRCLLVGEDIPQAVASQHQDIIRSVLVLRHRVDPDLNKDNKQRLKDGWCICIEICVFTPNENTHSSGIYTYIWRIAAVVQKYFMPHVGMLTWIYDNPTASGALLSTRLFFIMNIKFILKIIWFSELEFHMLQYS